MKMVRLSNEKYYGTQFFSTGPHFLYFMHYYGIFYFYSTFIFSLLFVIVEVFFLLACGVPESPTQHPQPFQPLGGVIKIHNSPRARNFSAPEFVGLISDAVFGATINFNFWKTLPSGWLTGESSLKVVLKRLGHCDSI